LHALSSAQLKVLSTAQLGAFSATQATVFTTAQTAGLSTAQLAVLTAAKEAQQATATAMSMRVRDLAQAMASYQADAVPAAPDAPHHQAASHLQLNIYAPETPQHLLTPTRK
jgi:hypothetical protein